MYKEYVRGGGGNIVHTLLGKHGDHVRSSFFRVRFVLGRMEIAKRMLFVRSE